MIKSKLVIYWARRDLRILDNPALMAAAFVSKRDSTSFLPVFIIEDYMVNAEPEYQFGYPSRYFLANSLPLFAKNFSKFLLVQSKAARYFFELSKNYDLEIFVNDDVYEDFYKQIKKLRDSNIKVNVLNEALSVPKETRTQEGNLYSVFTPFKKKVWSDFVQVKPQAKFSNKDIQYLNEEEFNSLPKQVENKTESLKTLFSQNRIIKIGNNDIDLDELTTKPNLGGWYFDEESALKRFSDYLKSGDLSNYVVNRDSLELDAETLNERIAYEGKTSRISLALAWGLVSSRILIYLIKKHFDEDFSNPDSSRTDKGALIFISELIWREFYRYQLYHHPELMDSEFQNKFRDSIKWESDSVAMERFVAWIKGETGYEVVDAAMKQIANTGWMHNRARMVVASILTKNLGVDWRWGQEYFRATLIDLDEASNNGGWQWGASVGADPKPIRIFSPDLQAKNYDKSSRYRDKWLQTGLLKIKPVPIVEHKDAREAALKRYGLNK
jgi:deoxyribodipyrimidine photo-lyase